MDDFILDKKIEAALNKQASGVHDGILERQRMQAAVHRRLEEERNMRHRSWKVMAAAAAAVCLMGGMTAMGLGKAAVYISHSNRNEAVNDYAAAEEMQKSYRTDVKMVEEFSNGYAFAEAVPHHSEAQDADGNTIEAGTAMSVVYEREGSESVYFEDGYSSLPLDFEADLSMTLDNGVVLQYSRMQNKFVPPDYVPTEEEQKLCEEGKLNLAYGSSEIEEMVSSMVQWEDGGITYSLFTFDEAITAEEMFQMAKEVVES